MLVSRWFQISFTLVSGRIQMVSGWFQVDLGVFSGLFQVGFNVASEWFQIGFGLVSGWFQVEFRRGLLNLFCGQNTVSDEPRWVGVTAPRFWRKVTL